MPTPYLETDRLILRKIHLDDANEIFNCWMQDEDVSRYMYWKASSDINDTKKFVEFELGNIENDEWNRWIIILKETSEIIIQKLGFRYEKDVPYECNGGDIYTASQKISRIRKEGRYKWNWKST